MGKMKKLMALAAAGVLCMSMGFNCLAAPSVTDPEPEPEANILVGQAEDKNGNHYDINIKELSKEVEDVLMDIDAVNEIFQEAGYVGKEGQDVTVYYIAAGDLSLEGAEVPEGGVDIPFTISKDEAKAGDTIYVMHQKHDGTWEILEGVIGANNEVTVHFDSLSPVAFVKMMSDGSVIVLDKEDNKLGEIDTEKKIFEKTEPKEAEKLSAAGSASDTKKSVSEKKSPKTGE